MLEIDPVAIMPYINTCLIERECDEILQIMADIDGEMTNVSENYFETMMTFSEEPECDNLSKNLSSVSESIYESSSVYEPKKAWSYQIELVQPAFGGKNTLICTPTDTLFKEFVVKQLQISL